MMISKKIDSREYFSMLVTQLSTGARMQLGLAPNPVTGKPAVNLEAAELTVGILETLLYKTAGNLNKEENQLLSQSVRDLKLTLKTLHEKHSI